MISSAFFFDEYQILQCVILQFYCCSLSNGKTSNCTVHISYIENYICFNQLSMKCLDKISFFPVHKDLVYTKKKDLFKKRIYCNILTNWNGLNTLHLYMFHLKGFYRYWLLSIILLPKFNTLHAGADSDAHIDLYYFTFMPNKCCSPSHLLHFIIWCFSQLHPISHCPSPLLILTPFFLSLSLSLSVTRRRQEAEAGEWVDRSAVACALGGHPDE